MINIIYFQCFQCFVLIRTKAPFPIGKAFLTIIKKLEPKGSRQEFVILAKFLIKNCFPILITLSDLARSFVNSIASLCCFTHEFAKQQSEFSK